MRAIETKIEIEASAETVWAIVNDLGAYREWNPFIIAAQGTPSPGQQLTVTMKPPGAGSTTLRPRVIAPSSERELRWRGRLGMPGIFDAEHSLAVEPLGAGRCVFHQRERFSGILVPLVGGMLDKTAAGFEEMNRALKSRAEARAA